MENKVLKLEKQLEELENKNINLYMSEVKKIKKSAIKIENEINNLLNKEDLSSSEECDKSDESSDESNNVNSIDIDIDEELNEYSKLVESLNSDEINNKTIEELNEIYNSIIKIERRINIYQKNKCELNIKVL